MALIICYIIAGIQLLGVGFNLWIFDPRLLLNISLDRNAFFVLLFLAIQLFGLLGALLIFARMRLGLALSMLHHLLLVPATLVSTSGARFVLLTDDLINASVFYMSKPTGTSVAFYWSLGWGTVFEQVTKGVPRGSVFIGANLFALFCALVLWVVLRQMNAAKAQEAREAQMRRRQQARRRQREQAPQPQSYPQPDYAEPDYAQAPYAQAPYAQDDYAQEDRQDGYAQDDYPQQQDFPPQDYPQQRGYAQEDYARQERPQRGFSQGDQPQRFHGRDEQARPERPQRGFSRDDYPPRDQPYGQPQQDDPHYDYPQRSQPQQRPQSQPPQRPQPQQQRLHPQPGVRMPPRIPPRDS
jgi:hypothetical protein